MAIKALLQRAKLRASVSIMLVTIITLLDISLYVVSTYANAYSTGKVWVVTLSAFLAVFKSANSTLKRVTLAFNTFWIASNTVASVQEKAGLTDQALRGGAFLTILPALPALRLIEGLQEAVESTVNSTSCAAVSANEVSIVAFFCLNN